MKTGKNVTDIAEYWGIEFQIDLKDDKRPSTTARIDWHEKKS